MQILSARDRLLSAKCGKIPTSWRGCTDEAAKERKTGEMLFLSTGIGSRRNLTHYGCRHVACVQRSCSTPPDNIPSSFNEPQEQT